MMTLFAASLMAAIQHGAVLAARDPAKPMAILIAISIAVAMILGILLVTHIQTAARRKAMESFALQHGFGFAESPDPAFVARFGDFDAFKRGRRQRFFNRVHGRHGRMTWEILDFNYTTGGGKHSRTHTLGVIAAHTDRSFPRMALRPESWTDKVASWFGSRDIATGNESFDREYHITGNDVDAIKSILSPNLIELVSAPPRYSWILTDDVIMLIHSRRFKPDQIPEVMRCVEEFVRRTSSRMT